MPTSPKLSKRSSIASPPRFSVSSTCPPARPLTRFAPSRRALPSLSWSATPESPRIYFVIDPAPPTSPTPNHEQLDASAESAKRERMTVIALVAMLFYQGFAAAIISVAAPWIATSFPLDGAAVARLFAWISLPALGALALSRMIDRHGRRRMILWCVAAIPVCSIAAALSTNFVAFTSFQIALYAVLGAAGAGCIVMLSEELPIARRARGQSFGGLAASVGAGFCVFLMPIFVAYGWSWRWMFAI